VIVQRDGIGHGLDGRIQQLDNQNQKYDAAQNNDFGSSSAQEKGAGY
jgi:hypothetical protein